MTHGARTTQDIYESVRDNLRGRIQTLTNFTGNSFNFIWTRAFAQEFRRNELQLTVAQLSGWVDYAGGPLTEGDLNDLGIGDEVDVEELEEFLDDTHLDELVRIVGITRDLGTAASGTVTFTTQSARTEIDAGELVGTQPDSSGDFLTYETTEDVVSSDGTTTVQAPIEAEEVGGEFNVGDGQITFLPNPPGGIQSVTNNRPVGGGEDRESNDELRERAKQAVFRSSGGGTVKGMIGFIEENTGADEVAIIEFPTGDSVRDYPHGHVIASGGTDAELRDAIAESRPASVEHILVGADIITLNIDIELQGGNINEAEVKERVQSFLQDLGLGDDLFEDQLIFTIISGDEDVENIAASDYSVEGETEPFDPSQDVYEMQLGDEMTDDDSGNPSEDGITQVTGTLNGQSHEFVEDTDYREWDTTNGNSTPPHDAIDWSIAKSTAPTETITFDTSKSTQEYPIDEDMVYDGITNVQNTTQGTTLTEATETTSGDYEEADTDGDNLEDGIRFLNDQNNNDTIEITYTIGDLPDVLVNQTFDETFDVEKERYDIDSGMIGDGIKEVTGTLNGTPDHTFIEGTDFEEWDANGDGRPEGIDWSIGGANPDNDTVFTVKYDAGTTFAQNYDIREGDLTVSEVERIDRGNVTVTVI